MQSISKPAKENTTGLFRLSLKDWLNNALRKQMKVVDSLDVDLNDYDDHYIVQNDTPVLI